MRKRSICGLFLALTTTGVAAISPVLAQFYVNPYANPYVNPCYNNYACRGYAPYGGYGWHNHTARNVAIGAGIGAAVGLLASHHGHRYW